MFRKKCQERIIANQGEKIIELENVKKKLERSNRELNRKNYDTSRENLNLIGTIDEMQDEFLNVLDTLEHILTTQNYNRPDLVISKAVAEIKYQKQIITEDKNIELENADDIN
jgi:hypothetical protein